MPPENTPVTYKLTVDINLMHETAPIAAMDKLKRWKSEGKIDLIEASPPREAAFSWPGTPPKYSNNPRDNRSRGRVKKEPSGGPNFKTVAAVLFPNKDSQKLSMTEINDVAHLVKHHSSKNEFFVTHNLKDFIEGGKRERLKNSFGIIAMTPAEAVETLSKIEGWK